MLQENPQRGRYLALMEKPEIKLEPHLSRNWALMPRCQALAKKTGRQCIQVARQGYKVCRLHGAGTKKREASGEKRPPGRPPITGLYSAQGRVDIQDLAEEVYRIEGALENSDRDLAVLKATLWFLTNQSEVFLGKATEFETSAELMSGVLESYVVVRPGKDGDKTTGRSEMTPEDAKTIGRHITTCYKLLAQIDSYVHTLADTATKTISAHRVRAEVAAKLAETKALETFSRYVQLNRGIVAELAPDDAFLDAYEARLRRELFGPARLALPDRDVDPDDLN